MSSAPVPDAGGFASDDDDDDLGGEYDGGWAGGGHLGDVLDPTGAGGEQVELVEAARKVARVEVNYSRAAKQVRALGSRCWMAVRWNWALAPVGSCLGVGPQPRVCPQAAAPLPAPPSPQVDVRALKEVMWRGLHVVRPQGATLETTFELQVRRWPLPALRAARAGSACTHGWGLWGTASGHRPPSLCLQPLTCICPPTRPHAGRAGHRAGRQPRGQAGGPVSASLLHLPAPPGQ